MKLVELDLCDVKCLPNSSESGRARKRRLISLDISVGTLDEEDLWDPRVNRKSEEKEPLNN